MRRIEYTNQFKRDYKRELQGSYKKALSSIFPKIIESLASDIPLETKFRDHALTGNWKEYRECHLKPDLLLIYSKVGNESIQLIRLGSHSELGL